MNLERNESVNNNNLMKAIGKSEILNEQYEEAREEIEEESENIEGWLTVFLKAVKNVFLN